MADEKPVKERVTRKGKPLFDPQQSDIYSVNPCPPVLFLGRKECQFVDDEGCMYWDALADAQLRAWVEKSSLLGLVAHQSDVVENEKSEDRLFFIRQDAQSKKDKAVWVLPDVNSELTLHAKTNLTASRCVVKDVGQRKTASYSARAVNWILVTGLK